MENSDKHVVNRFTEIYKHFFKESFVISEIRVAKTLLNNPRELNVKTIGIKDPERELTLNDDGSAGWTFDAYANMLTLMGHILTPAMRATEKQYFQNFNYYSNHWTKKQTKQALTNIKQGLKGVLK